jgi:hypothetical protein
LADDPDAMAALVDDDVKKLGAGGVNVGIGDIKCITRGHLIRLAIWHLHRNWDKSLPTAAKLSAISNEVEKTGGQSAIERSILGVPTGEMVVTSASLNFRVNE